METGNSVRLVLKVLGILPAFLFLNLTAQAQAFVSAKIGFDGGTCPVTAPCRTITYSLTQAGDGGTVNVIDSGLYEPFVVNKSMTVQAAPGVVAVITRNTAGPGITVDVGSTELITIRGLTLNLPDNLLSPPGAVSPGFSLTGNGAIHIERCIVRGFTVGIDAKMTGLLFVRDTLVGGGTTGMNINANYLSLKVHLERCQALRSGTTGLNATTSPSAVLRLTVRDSEFSGITTGVRIAPDVTGTADANFENCSITNSKFGLSAEAAGASVRVSNSTITDNGQALLTSGGAALLSRGNNTVEGNSINGNFTGTFSAK